jgi:hypothetical protein
MLTPCVLRRLRTGRFASIAVLIDAGSWTRSAVFFQKSLNNERSEPISFDELLNFDKLKLSKINFPTNHLAMWRF